MNDTFLHHSKNTVYYYLYMAMFRPKYEKILEEKRCKTQTFKKCEDDPRCSREIIQIPWWVITFKTAKSRRSIALNYQRIYCKPLVAKILCPKTCGHCK